MSRIEINIEDILTEIEATTVTTNVIQSEFNVDKNGRYLSQEMTDNAVNSVAITKTFNSDSYTSFNENCQQIQFLMDLIQKQEEERNESVAQILAQAHINDEMGAQIQLLCHTIARLKAEIEALRALLASRKNKDEICLQNEQNLFNYPECYVQGKEGKVKVSLINGGDNNYEKGNYSDEKIAARQWLDPYGTHFDPENEEWEEFSNSDFSARNDSTGISGTIQRKMPSGIVFFDRSMNTNKNVVVVTLSSMLKRFKKDKFNNIGDNCNSGDIENAKGCQTLHSGTIPLLDQTAQFLCSLDQINNEISKQKAFEEDVNIRKNNEGKMIRNLDEFISIGCQTNSISLVKLAEEHAAIESVKSNSDLSCNGISSKKEMGTDGQEPLKMDLFKQELMESMTREEIYRQQAEQLAIQVNRRTSELRSLAALLEASQNRNVIMSKLLNITTNRLFVNPYSYSFQRPPTTILKINQNSTKVESSNYPTRQGISKISSNLGISKAKQAPFSSIGKRTSKKNSFKK